MIFGQSGSDKFIIGMDLGEESVQLSYIQSDMSSPQTLSQVVGEEDYSIPMVMCKRPGVNQWYFGKEAVSYSVQNQVEPLTGLLSLAKENAEVTIEGQTFDSVALLALFLKRCVGMVVTLLGTDKIGGLMLTGQAMDEEDADFFSKVVEKAKIKTELVYCQSHEESFYYYLLGQQTDLLEKTTMLLECRGSRLTGMVMRCNPFTTPRVLYCNVSGQEFPIFEDEDIEVMDQELAYRCSDLLRQDKPDAVYLIGEAFVEQNIQETLGVLCSQCRVFLGNNLFSKGACIAMRETALLPSELGKRYVYLGENKLSANIGMQLFIQGQENYMALLDAGDGWKTAEKTVELYIKEQDVLEFQAVSMIGREDVNETIFLEGLPAGVSRLRLEIYMETRDELVVRVSDLGFGEIRPATQMTWEKRIRL